MKIPKLKKIEFNNRKKEFDVFYKSGQKVTLHFGQLGIQSNLLAAGVDPESKGIAFFYKTETGAEDFVPYDIPLILAKDPDYLFQIEVEELTADIKKKMESKGITKKFLARSLGTSDIQIQRLLNADNPNKNFLQLNKIAHILGLNLSLKLQKMAA